ncbi:hypothetical protein C8Q74DRAFT_1220970 [Fomes fomentarius]|nr:hypothetical protein C8Q74DRAFT_1220970 [Fomes fomentarius]
MVVNFDRGSVPPWNAPTPDMDDGSSIRTLSNTPSSDNSGPYTPFPSSPRLFGSPVVVDASGSGSIALAQAGPSEVCQAELGVGAGGVSNYHPYSQYPPVELDGPGPSSSAHGHPFMLASAYGPHHAQLPESQGASVPFRPTVPQDACPDCTGSKSGKRSARRASSSSVPVNGNNTTAENGVTAPSSEQSRPYVCPYCNRGWTKKHDLKRHTGEAPRKIPGTNKLRYSTPCPVLRRLKAARAESE